MRTLGVLLLAGAGYYVYKHLGDGKRGLGPLSPATPIPTPPGAAVPFTPPGMSCVDPLPAAIAWLGTAEARAALAAATNPQTSYKTTAAIQAFLERYPAGCRPALALTLKETGVHQYFVNNALAQAK